MIPWVRNPDGTQGYSLNPIKGKCPMACSYCYARKLYDRFKWNPELRYIGRQSLFNEVLRIPRDKPQRIFVGSTMELFGDWIRPFWMNDIFEVVNTFSFFTFIFLTKQPQNLVKWSPFPKNCYVGVTITCDDTAYNSYVYLTDVKASVRYISFEPLLSDVSAHLDLLTEVTNWWILGCQTQPLRLPQKEWVDEIMEAADKAKVPIFVKPPLSNLFGINRQEMPLDNARDKPGEVKE